MPRIDDDSLPNESNSLRSLASTRPVTFLADGCQIVVACAAGSFDIAFAGALVHTNRRTVGEVLEVFIGTAKVMRLCLRRLDELDAAGAAMLDDLARAASRSHTTVLVVDGSPTWRTPFSRLDSTSANGPPPTVAWRSKRAEAPTPRRSRRRVLPTT